MTDWWMQPAKSPEFPALRDQAYRVRAPGGCVYARRRPGQAEEMSDGTLLKVYGKPEGITLGELQRGAKNVLRFVMASTAMERGHTD